MVKQVKGKTVDLISAAQNITTGWVNLGDVIDTRGVNSLGVFVNIDLNGGADIRVRAVGRVSEDSAEDFVFPIKTVTASDVKLEDEYFEFNVDADQKMVISIPLDSVIPFVQIQVSAGTAGTSQIDDAKVSFGYLGVI